MTDNIGNTRLKNMRIQSEGSILGPDIWNVLCDGLLSLDMSHGVFLVGYAADVAAVISARISDLVKCVYNRSWLGWANG